MEVSVYCSIRELPHRDFAHRLISESQVDDPSASAHLQSLFLSLQDAPEMAPSLFALLRHLDRTRHILRLETSPDDRQSLEHWAEKSLGVILQSNGEFTDHRGRLLYSASREADPSAELPRPIEGVQRRERTRARLKSGSLEIPTHLPLVISEPEVVLRSPQEIAQRCLALLLVALRGESLGSGEPIPLDELKQLRPESFAYLTPQERHFLDDSEFDPSANVAMSWRYESLLTLLWAIDLQELPPASEICEVASLVDKMLAIDEAELSSRARLRDTSIVLDALDLVFCQHWLARQAELEQSPPIESINSGIVLERNYALSWLTRFEPCDWDEICTPT